MSVAREELGEVGPTVGLAGSGRQLVGQRLVVGKAEPTRFVGGDLVALDGLGGGAALPVQLGLQQDDLRLRVVGAVLDEQRRPRQRGAELLGELENVGRPPEIVEEHGVVEAQHVHVAVGDRVLAVGNAQLPEVVRLAVGFRMTQQAADDLLNWRPRIWQG